LELASLIVATPPRENAGSRTTKQYDYQKDVSLHKLIEHYQKSTDFVFIFDFHDDLLIFDKENNPDKIEFFQIKSKHTGNITLNWLKSKGIDEKLSIVGKLYHNKVLFSDYAKSISIISNQPYNIDLKDPNESSLAKFKIECKELSAESINLIKAAIQKEHGLPNPPSIEALFYLTRSKLSLEDSASHCSGSLSQLFHALNPNYSTNVELAYRSLFNEIRIKSAAIIGDSDQKSWEKLKQIKGITRKQFHQMLDKAGVYKSLEDAWKEIEGVLQADGMGYLEVKKLKADWRTVNARILSDSSNLPLNQLINEVDRVIAELKGSPRHQQSKLTELMKEGLDKLGDAIKPPFDTSFVKALILRQLHHEA